MNFHSDTWINDNVEVHLRESLEYFNINRLVGIFYQGSGNYGLDYEGSDVDTKLIVTPTFRDIAMNKSPVSTTHIRANSEHTDWKDIRLYLQTFRKQNLNFLEILFTSYKFINTLYESEWNKLVENREAIAHYSAVQGIQSMRGIAKEKYFAMEHHYPARMDWINKFGYDPKQLHHLVRIKEFIDRFLADESYENCLVSKQPEYLQAIKLGQAYKLDEARDVANQTIQHIDAVCTKFLETCSKEVDKKVDNLLDDVQYNIMCIAIKEELE